MTGFEIQRLRFARAQVNAWAPLDRRNTNWPVVYVLDGATPFARTDDPARSVYVGESINAAARMRQHLDSPEKALLTELRVIVDSSFNKSVCLDLESYLIRMLAGDGGFRVMNRNDGITDADYFDRERYRETFRQVFDELKDQGVFTRSIPEIENSDLFKLSPFKALTDDQAAAVEDIVEGLFEDLESGESSTIVIQGDPGTGKTIVAIFLLKLLKDIEVSTDLEDLDSDSFFSEFFAEGYRELLADLQIGLVIPQQSLRESVKRVFRKTPGLRADMVLTPYEVGVSDRHFDVLIVDEAHRLNQRANQSSGMQNKKFKEITESLFGADDITKTQLDWIRAKSRHQILLLDSAQSVRPADLPIEVLSTLVDSSRISGRHFRLATQMRVQGGADYVSYVRRLLGAESAATPLQPTKFPGYDFRLFDSLQDMRSEIERRDAVDGLSRMVAGYAWEWKTKTDKTAFDIELEGISLRWNSSETDWIAKPGSLHEVGSIHTVQGYDLNYAGVIIGPDLRFDPIAQSLLVDRKSYKDAKGKEGNKVLGKVYDDNDLRRFITNIYAVLMTRGMRGTYLYVCDRSLREHLRKYIPTA